MLSPMLPAQERALELNEAFPSLKNSVVIVVRGDTPDAADMAVLALTEALRKETTRLSNVFSVVSDPFLASNGFLYRDTDAVNEMFTRISKSANLVARLRQNQTVDGFAESLSEAALLAERADISADALNRLYREAKEVFKAHRQDTPRIFSWSAVLDDEANVGSTTRLVSVTPVLDRTRLSPARPALDAIDRLIADLPPPATEGVEISVTGEPALRAEEMRSVFGTIGVSLGLSLCLVAFILRLGLGSIPRAMLAFGSLLVSLALTTGFAALFVGTLNLVSVAFIVLMVGLGIDFAIHILAHIVEMRRHGTDHIEAVALTGQRNGLALNLSAITTSLAFLAFAFTDFDGMAQLGLIGAAGVLIAFAVAATMIPALCSLFPGLGSAPAKLTNGAQGPHWVTNLAPAVVLALGIISIWPATQSRFDADPIGLRDPAAPSVQAFRHLAEDPETTPYRGNILAGSRENAAEIASRFENVPGIGEAIWISDLVPTDQDEKLMVLDIAAPSIEHAVSGEPTELSASTSGAAALQELTERLEGAEGAAGELYEALVEYQKTRTVAADEDIQKRLFDAFPLMLSRLDALLDADYITEEGLPAPLLERFVSEEGLFRVEIIPEDPVLTTAEIDAFAARIEAIHHSAAGGPNQLSAAGATVGSAMLSATLIAALATMILALIATRSLVDTLAILVPLTLAGLITAASGVFLDMPFNYANVIVLPLLIGIGVDSGIHIAMREKRAPGAVFSTSTPRAVLFSALTTMAAFGTLALSDHQGTASMGILLAVAMTAAVGCVLSLTPWLIRLGWRNSSKTVR
jgi:hopanoid biosynthesis associated RND transporter like protein HpnN